MKKKKKEEEEESIASLFVPLRRRRRRRRRRRPGCRGSGRSTLIRGRCTMQHKRGEFTFQNLVLFRVLICVGKEEEERSKKLHSRTHLTKYVIMFALSSTVATRAVRAP